MINKQEELIDKSLLLFKRGDFYLGFSALLYSSLNTGSEKIFLQPLAFVELYENESNKDKSSLFLLFEECAVAVRSIKIENKDLLGKIILKAEKIIKNYNKGKFVFAPVNVVLKKGHIFSLVGENGNGKTTL